MLIEQLKTKIDALKKNFVALQEENKVLKTAVEAHAGANESEVEQLRSSLLDKEAEIVKLKKEIHDKDQEIEVVIAQVEALIGTEQ